MKLARGWFALVGLLGLGTVCGSACGSSGGNDQKTGPDAVSETADAGVDSGVSSGGGCTDAASLNAAQAKCVSDAAPVDGPFQPGEADAYCRCLYARWAAKLNCTEIASRDFQPKSDPDQCYCMEQQRPYCDTTAADTQTVQCQSAAQGLDSVYLLTRNADGSADVSCNSSSGNGALVSNEVHFDAGSDAALLAICTLNNFPTAGAKITFQRIETDLDQPVDDPATVVHGGVTVDLDRGNGTHANWIMGDADPSRNLPGECTDSTGN